MKWRRRLEHGAGDGKAASIRSIIDLDRGDAEARPVLTLESLAAL